MDQNICRRCGKSIPGGEALCCTGCTGAAGAKIRSGRHRYWIGGVLLALLAGGLLWLAHTGGWDFSWEALTGEPVAVVNGDPVPRKAFRQRLAIAQGMLERQYGKDLFAGGNGPGLLAALERHVLERMVDDRLVAQEAQRLNVRVADGQVQREMEIAGREIYGSREKFRDSLKDDGIPEEYLFDQIRHLLLRRAVAEAKTPLDADADATLSLWLVQARRSPGVVLTRGIGSRSLSREVPPCCDTDRGGGTATGKADAGPDSKAGAAALAEYRRANPPGQDAAARVIDDGCHIQVDVEQGGRIVRSYTYQDGKVLDN